MRQKSEGSRGSQSLSGRNEESMETENKLNGKAIASLVVSCISVVNCCLWYAAILCAVIGIVLGILALRDGTKRQQDLAVAGIVVGSVGLALGIVIAVLIMLMSAAEEGMPGLPDGTDTVLMAVKNAHFVKVFFAIH